MGSITPNSASTISACNNCINECSSKMGIIDGLIETLNKIDENQKTIDETATNMLPKLGTDITFAKIEPEVKNKISDALEALKSAKAGEIIDLLNGCKSYYSTLKSEFERKKKDIEYQQWLESQKEEEESTEDGAEETPTDDTPPDP